MPRLPSPQLLYAWSQSSLPSASHSQAQLEGGGTSSDRPDHQTAKQPTQANTAAAKLTNQNATKRLTPAEAFAPFADPATSTTVTPLGHGKIHVSLPIFSNNYPGIPPGGQWLPPTQGAVGWHVNKSTATPDLYGAQYALGNMPGLALWLTGSLDTEYNPGYTEWVYTSPGTTRLSSASITQSWRDKIYRADHCTEIGLRTGSEQRATDYHCNPPEGTDQGDGWYKRDLYLEDPSATPTAKEVFFKLVFPDCKNPPSNPQPSCSKNIPPLDPVTNGWTTRMERVNLVLVDDDLPTVEARPTDPQIVEVDGRSYVNGRTDVTVAVAGKDAGSGVKHVGVTKLDGGEVVGADAPCDPAHNTPALDARICPLEFSQNLFLPVASTPYDEGKHSFSGSATDVADNAATLAYWDIFVDRTPPPSPQTITASFDEETSETNIGWKPGQDPNLIDGSAGSGLKHFVYRYRLRPPGALGFGDWTSWSATDEPGFAFSGGAVDYMVEVQVYSVDSVDNTSGLASATLTVTTGSSCSPQYDADFLLDGRMHLGQLSDDPTIDSFALSAPVTASELDTIIPSNAEVVSLLAHQKTSNGDFLTGGLSVEEGGSWQTAAVGMRAHIEDTTDAFREQLLRQRSTGSESARTAIDRERARLKARSEAIDELGGAPLRSFAILHNPAVAQEILKRGGAQVTTAEIPVVDPNVECDPEVSTSSSSRQRYASVASQKDSARAAAVSEDSYTPPWSAAMGEFISFDGRPLRRVYASWQWISAHNRRYWSAKPGPTSNWGVEVQVEMDRENPTDGSWAEPSWGVHSPSRLFAAWTANFNCPYVDDYYKDDIKSRYQLTIGQACRPGGTSKIYQWSHDLAIGTDPGADHIRMSSQPVRKTNLSFRNDAYCTLWRKRKGSCYFEDQSAGILKNDHDPARTPVLPRFSCFVKRSEYLSRCGPPPS